MTVRELLDALWDLNSREGLRTPTGDGTAVKLDVGGAVVDLDSIDVRYGDLVLVGTLTPTVRMPDPKPKPKFQDVDCAADLKELMDAVMEYNSDRDAEWDFVDDHGLDASGWTEEQAEEHDQILADIAKKREWIQGILRRVTGDVTLEF